MRETVLELLDGYKRQKDSYNQWQNELTKAYEAFDEARVEFCKNEIERQVAWLYSIAMKICDKLIGHER